MTRDPVLLPEESVICGCKQEEGAILLTSDGWLAQEASARFEGLTRLHRLLHLSKIESLQPVEAQKHNGIAQLVLMATLVSTSALFCYIILDNSEELWGGRGEYYICADGQEIPYDLWSDGQIKCVDGSDEGFDPLLLVIFSPMILGVLLNYVGLDTDDEKIMSIVHENGTMNLEEFSGRLGLLWKFYGLSFWTFFILNALDGLNPFLQEYKHHVVLGLCLLFLWNQIQQNREKDEGAEEITYVSLEGFHENLSTALGLSERGSGNQEVRALSDSMGGELEIIRKRLEEHEEILTQIVVHYDHIYSGSTHWMGTSAVRASTEILLAHRLRELLPNPSKETRTLANYRDQLKKHDSGMDSEVLRSIDVIVSLGNAAAHNMEATKQDYLSALQKFADVVEWHLSTPPKSIIGS